MKKSLNIVAAEFYSDTIVDAVLENFVKFMSIQLKLSVLFLKVL